MRRLRRPSREDLLWLLDIWTARAVDHLWADQIERAFECWLCAFDLALELNRELNSYLLDGGDAGCWSWRNFDRWVRDARAQVSPRAQTELLTARLATFGQTVRG